MSAEAPDTLQVCKEEEEMAQLICPRDGENLVSQEVEGHPVQACPRCEGIYLEPGELNEIAEPIPGDLEVSTLELDTFDHPDSSAPGACPRCRPVTMKKVEFVDYSGIILDHCPQCRGFWLDGHELESINREVRRLNKTASEIHDPPWLFLVRLMASLTR